jgi:prepilin-type N-terminal cleavage/methylation domain-containing protein
MSTSTPPSGFTLIELLVVIAIIGTLSMVVTVALSDLRTRSTATQIVAQMKEIDKAFQIYALGEDISEWWRDSSDNGYDSDRIQDLIVFNPSEPAAYRPSLNLYLVRAPIPPQGISYRYRNDGNSTTLPCDTSGSTIAFAFGITIIIEEMNADGAVAEYADQIVDGGDGPLCGRIRFGGSSNSLYYLLSPNEDDL